MPLFIFAIWVLKQEYSPKKKQMIAVVVVANFKSGDSQIFENYRPISSLVALSKILEKIIIH